MDIARALNIDGWMSEKELDWLAEQAQTHSRIVEVGSYLGRSTRAMADNTSGKIIAFDNWAGPWEVDMSSAERASLLGRFKENLADHLETRRVLMFIGDHHLPPKRLMPDMVFVDGGHTIDEAQRDIAFWKDELTPGGLLCGHDFDYLPVQEAITNTIGLNNVASTERIWSWNKPLWGDRD